MLLCPEIMPTKNSMGKSEGYLQNFHLVRKLSLFPPFPGPAVEQLLRCQRAGKRGGGGVTRDWAQNGKARGFLPGLRMLRLSVTEC